MKHVFDTEIAALCGTNSATVFEMIRSWVEQNKATGKNFHDGHFWICVSKRMFADIFPYMTERQIGIAIQKLVEKGLVLTGNYSQNPMDRTSWYTISGQEV